MPVRERPIEVTTLHKGDELESICKILLQQIDFT